MSPLSRFLGDSGEGGARWAAAAAAALAAASGPLCARISGVGLLLGWRGTSLAFGLAASLALAACLSRE
eukprot:6257167-Alexandrium_andersonii.AAC.1